MFKIVSPFKPTGDQPEAIKKLVAGIKKGLNHQTLLGVTGSGKTFTMANVISQIKKPTLVISHNKTLAAQLYQELREFFPENSVHYFVSYYDYYQPEAYIPHSDTYIEKDARINQEIDRLRHAATQALLTRNDVIIVASVSCIYNLGSPEDYKKLSLRLFEGQKIKAQDITTNLLRLQYQQDIELKQGTFRKTSDEYEIIPPTGDSIIRIKIRDSLPAGKAGKIERISIARHIDPENLGENEYHFEHIVETRIFPAKYWVATDDKLAVAVENIKTELQQHLPKLKKAGKHLEAARLKERTEFDIQMIQQVGYCHGIENYSRHIDFREAGEPPFTLLDFFKTKKEFLTIIDESHITIPQVRGMHAGDHSRKTTLVNYGFRLPSTLDNRPLRFEEFWERVGKVIYVSATPNAYELKKSGKEGLVEQLTRPTGLLDPTIQIHPTEGQIDHLVQEIKNRTANGQRVLVTTLTKRMAEDLTDYLATGGIRVNYIHSEIKTLERLEIIRDLRLGKYDVIVGVNLLREGLDLPEVSLVAILDADKEGFLRNSTTLIQTMGRAARHVDGHIILYADKTTRSMANAIDEINRRRTVQEKYNKKFGITPQSIIKEVKESGLPSQRAVIKQKTAVYDFDENRIPTGLKADRLIEQMTKAMEKAVKDLQFDRAMFIREQIKKIRATQK